jgi:hypothetical protein
MDATDVIAGFAAVVASAALAWEVWKRRQSRRLRLKVQFKAWEGKDGWVLWIRVINLSDFPVRVMNVRVRGVQAGSSWASSLWAKLLHGCRRERPPWRGPGSGLSRGEGAV